MQRGRGNRCRSLDRLPRGRAWRRNIPQLTQGAPEVWVWVFWGGKKTAFCFPLGQIESFWDERQRWDSTRDLFTEVETPRVKQTPPHPHAAGMGFKAPTGKKAQWEWRTKKIREEGTTSWRCRRGEGSLFLGCWRLLTKTWQNPPRFPPLWRGQGRRGVVPEGRTGSIPSDLDLIFAEGGTCKDEVKSLHRGCPQVYQYPSFSLENPPCSQAPRGWFGLEQVWAVEWNETFKSRRELAANSLSFRGITGFSGYFCWSAGIGADPEA